MDTRPPAAFTAALAAPVPPADWTAPLAALWWLAKGDLAGGDPAAGAATGFAPDAWERAHALVQDETGPDAAWVHAHLHRVEGDPENAGYWYARAGRARPDGSVAEERAAIARALVRAP